MHSATKFHIDLGCFLTFGLGPLPRELCDSSISRIFSESMKVPCYGFVKSTWKAVSRNCPICKNSRNPILSNCQLTLIHRRYCQLISWKKLKIMIWGQNGLLGTLNSSNQEEYLRANVTLYQIKNFHFCYFCFE